MRSLVFLNENADPLPLDQQGDAVIDREYERWLVRWDDGHDTPPVVLHGGRKPRGLLPAKGHVATWVNAYLKAGTPESKRADENLVVLVGRVGRLELRHTDGSPARPRLNIAQTANLSGVEHESILAELHEAAWGVDRMVRQRRQVPERSGQTSALDALTARIAAALQVAEQLLVLGVVARGTHPVMLDHLPTRTTPERALALGQLRALAHAPESARRITAVLPIEIEDPADRSMIAYWADRIYEDLSDDRREFSRIATRVEAASSERSRSPFRLTSQPEATVLVPNLPVHEDQLDDLLLDLDQLRHIADGLGPWNGQLSNRQRYDPALAPFIAAAAGYRRHHEARRSIGHGSLAIEQGVLQTPFLYERWTQLVVLRGLMQRGFALNGDDVDRLSALLMDSALAWKSHTFSLFHQPAGLRVAVDFEPRVNRTDGGQHREPDLRLRAELEGSTRSCVAILDAKYRNYADSTQWTEDWDNVVGEKYQRIPGDVVGLLHASPDRRQRWDAAPGQSSRHKGARLGHRQLAIPLRPDANLDGLLTKLFRVILGHVLGCGEVCWRCGSIGENQGRTDANGHRFTAGTPYLCPNMDCGSFWIVHFCSNPNCPNTKPEAIRRTPLIKAATDGPHEPISADPFKVVCPLCGDRGPNYTRVGDMPDRPPLPDDPWAPADHNPPPAAPDPFRVRPRRGLGPDHYPDGEPIPPPPEEPPPWGW